MESPLMRTRSAVRDAPSEEEFERLYQATLESPSYERQVEDQFILLATGRLGLRSGEVLHFLSGDNKKWIDRESKQLKIPHHVACGCRYCQEQAQQAVETKPERDFEHIIDRYWKPKYSPSARAIPYDWSPRIVEVVERFTDLIGGFNIAQSTLNRRVNTLHERAGISGNTYPHALRAAAACWWANRGMSSPNLQAYFGWKDMRVAEAYIRLSGKELQKHVSRLLDQDPEVPDVDGPEPQSGEHSRPRYENETDTNNMSLFEVEKHLEESDVVG